MGEEKWVRGLEGVVIREEERWAVLRWQLAQEVKGEEGRVRGGES